MNKEMNTINYCIAPWNLLRIESNGNCYSCSSAYVKNDYYFGNIFEDSIEEIWNGERARLFREDKLEKQYNFCQKDRCNLFLGEMPIYTTIPTKLENNSVSRNSIYIAPYPVYISLSYDFSCSEQCIFCRDKTLILEEETAKKWENILYSKILPLLTNTKLLEITCSGELLVSKHSQYILKEILKKYPNIKIKLFSNGILCNEEKFKELGIINNIEEICISIHCSNPKTYKKIFRKDNYKKVIENIKYIGKLKEQAIINSFFLQFVITKFNYKEIKDFIKLAKEHNAFPVFSFVVENNETSFCKNYYNYSIHKENHYLYNDFVNTIQDPFVINYMPDFLKGYKKINKLKILKNYINYLFYIIKRKRIQYEK